MKTPEDEAFDELARKQGAWGGGFPAKRQAAMNKINADFDKEYKKMHEDRVKYGTAWSQDGKRIDPTSVYKEPAAMDDHQTLEALKYAASKGYGHIVRENSAPFTIKAVLAQPAQEPVCDKDPQGCWNVRCQLGKQCKNLAQPAQEPVACVGPWDGPTLTLLPRSIHQTFEHNQPLYAAPPQRPWVRLTEEERASFEAANPKTQEEWDELFDGIEAKLRSKNT